MTRTEVDKRKKRPKSPPKPDSTLSEDEILSYWEAENSTRDAPSESSHVEKTRQEVKIPGQEQSGNNGDGAPPKPPKA